MYAALDVLRAGEKAELLAFPNEDVLYNDFERVAPDESNHLIEELRRTYAMDAGLSGSGSAVFGRFRTQWDAEKAQKRISGVACKAWVAMSLGRAQSLA
jgi:4-diphosphocytidyl-2C-methyl-D-erythritol kinase